MHCCTPLNIFCVPYRGLWWWLLSGAFLRSLPSLSEPLWRSLWMFLGLDSLPETERFARDQINSRLNLTDMGISLYVTYQLMTISISNHSGCKANLMTVFNKGTAMATYRHGPGLSIGADGKWKRESMLTNSRSSFRILWKTIWLMFCLCSEGEWRTSEPLLLRQTRRFDFSATNRKETHFINRL